MLDWSRFCRIKEIKKGWSGDKKYQVWDKSGKEFFLRISPPEKNSGREELFSILGRLEKLPVALAEALEFGPCQEGSYTIYRWVEGVELEPILPHLPLGQQEELGLSAGRMLRHIHAIPAPPELAGWAERYNRKIEQRLAAYAACGQELTGEASFLAYISENRALLAKRPQCFTHGDYHAGNMMLEEEQLVIIDFDRFDYADPWEEFNRISWCATASPEFATARIEGYFSGQPPEEFFRLLALYISVNTVSSLPWAIAFGADEIAVMQEQAAMILDWYDNMQDLVPSWYKWSREARPVRCNYDFLISQDNDPCRDGPELRAYMDKFDGQIFLAALDLAKTDRVLEIGVGSGRLAQQVLGKCREFTGIDLSAPTLAKARQNLTGQAGLQLITGNFLTYPFNSQFELIFSSLTIWHIRDKAALYKKAYQLLAPGGRFVFTISRKQDRQLGYPGSKLELYPDNPAETEGLLQLNGFIVKERLLTEYSLIFVAEKPLAG